MLAMGQLCACPSSHPTPLLFHHKRILKILLSKGLATIDHLFLVSFGSTILDSILTWACLSIFEEIFSWYSLIKSQAFGNFDLSMPFYFWKNFLMIFSDKVPSLRRHLQSCFHVFSSKTIHFDIVPSIYPSTYFII